MKNARRGARRGRNERGIQLVELSIVLPVMFMLMAVIVEFGNYYHTFNTLSKATRVAARYISTKDLSTTEIDKAKNMAVCGSTSTCTSTTSVLPNFTAANVSVTNTGNALYPQTVTVAITGFTYQPLFDLSRFASTLVWSNVPVAASTTMRHGYAD